MIGSGSQGREPDISAILNFPGFPDPFFFPSCQEEFMSLNDSQEFFIQWHLTERCNLRCSHCYQSGGASAELSLAEVRDVIDEVEDLIQAWETDYGLSFAPGFNITGGEPFLRQDLFDILAPLCDKGFAVYILSNGTLVSGEKAKKLTELGVKGVQVSIEGPQEVHEAIRGKGSFARALHGVGNLLEAGLAVTLNVTLSDMNVDYFMDLIDLAHSLGVQRLGFSRLVPVGRGKALLANMSSKERIKGIYERIFPLDSKDLEITTGDPVASQMRSAFDGSDGGSVPRAGCAAGLAGLTLLADGTLVPCRRLFIPLGNIRRDSLREVWAVSEILAALRDRRQYRGKCGCCPRWAVCRGCRAIAYAWSLANGGNDFLSEDPQCFIDE